jgi:hypothetical protein
MAREPSRTSQESRTPESNYEPSGNNECTADKNRPPRTDVEKYQVYDLRDDKEQGDIYAKELAKVPSRGIDGDAIPKEHHCTGSKQTKATGCI